MQALPFGIGSQRIHQPGLSPFVKLAEGTAAPGLITGFTDDELAPLAPIHEPSDPETEELAPLKPLSPETKIMQELLRKSMSIPCAVKKYRLPKFVLGRATITFVDGLTPGDEQTEEATTVTYEEGSTTVIGDKGRFYISGPGEIEFLNSPLPASHPSVQHVLSIKKEFDKDGIQATLSTGIQVPGTFTPVKDYLINR